jgi:DNA recombination protein RmuC
MKSLAGKKYWEHFPKAPDFVVMFFPSEALLAAAAENDPALIADALSEHVAITTPTTLFALLRAVEKSWMEAKQAESAQQISDLGRDLYERILIFLEHFVEVGSSLKSALEAYNRAAGSAESRLVSGARRFQKMGVDSKRPIPQLELITEIPRTIAASAGDE